MANTTESVLFNLRELQCLEAQRIQHEAEAERARIAQQQALQRKQLEELEEAATQREAQRLAEQARLANQAQHERELLRARLELEIQERALHQQATLSYEHELHRLQAEARSLRLATKANRALSLGIATLLVTAGATYRFHFLPAFAESEAKIAAASQKATEYAQQVAALRTRALEESRHTRTTTTQPVTSAPIAEVVQQQRPPRPRPMNSKALRGKLTAETNDRDPLGEILLGNDDPIGGIETRAATERQTPSKPRRR